MSKAYLLPSSQLGAFSVEQGIAISTTAFTDIQKATIFVSYDKNGGIKTDYLNQSIELTFLDFKEMDREQNDTIDKGATIFSIVFFALACILSALIGNKYFTIVMAIFAICAYSTGANHNVSWYLSNAIYHAKHKQIGRYHAAEHMAMKAYSNCGHVPSLQEIKQESMYDANCSTTRDIVIPTLQSLANTIILTIAVTLGSMLLSYLAEVFNLPLLHGAILPIGFFIIKYVEKFIESIHEWITVFAETPFIMKITQRFVLAKPNDNDLFLAQTAVRERENVNREIREHPEEFLTEDVNFDIENKQAIFTVKNGQRFAVSIDEYACWIESFKKAKLSEEIDDGDNIEEFQKKADTSFNAKADTHKTANS